MESIIRPLIYSHIAAGMLSLVAAPVAMVVAKGGATHRLFGKIFFWCLTWIFISATVLSVYKSNHFLLLIGVFSYYSVVTGYRSLFLKRLHTGGPVGWTDWFATMVAGGFNIYFLYEGIGRVLGGDIAIGLLSLLFGGIGVLTVAGNLRRFTKPPADKNEWLFQHISGFVAGFIASVTAFSTQTMTFLPGFLAWIWPTLVGTPLIIFWIRFYRKQLKNGVRLSELVELRR